MRSILPKKSMRTTATIRTIIEYEIVGENTGPHGVKRGLAVINLDSLVLLGDVKLPVRTKIAVRCSFNTVEDRESFTAIATVTSSTKKSAKCEWKLLDSDRMQLEEALRNAQERAA